MKRIYAILALLAYAGLPVLANWMIGNIGTPIPNGPHVIPVGFGLFAPSGVLVAGLALAWRDLAQELGGRWLAFGAVLLGALVSYLVTNPFIAQASAMAFLLSEVLDFAIYTPLRLRGRLISAVMLSNTAGLLLDTLAFLGLAGLLTPDLFAGQVVGKLWVTFAAVAAVAIWRARK